MNKQELRKITHIITRKVSIVAVAVALSIYSQARNDTIVPVNKNPEKILRKIDVRDLTRHGFNFWQDDFSGNWAGIDFGFNYFMNPDYTGYVDPFMKPDIFRSNSTYINLIQQSIGLQRNRNTIGLVTGLGLQLQSYRLERNTTIQQIESGRIEPQTLDFDQNQKSKLSLVSLTVPLLAEFQIPVKQYQNRIHLSGGFYGGVRLGSHTKIKYRLDRKKEKLKTPGHFYLQDFKYGLMVRAGYRRINVFATYELLPLFKEGKGPNLIPVTIGVTLINF